MGAWRAIGDYIGHHMMWISPACVLVACLFPDQVSLLHPAVTPLFAFVSFQGALSNTLGSSRDAIARPLPILVTLALSIAALPALAFALASLLFGFDQQIVCGILLEYSVPVAALTVMWCGIGGGNQALSLVILLASSLLSPVTLPLTLRLLMGQTIQVDLTSMMLNLLLTVAIPVVVGTLTNDLSHGSAKRRLAPPLAPAARIAMVAIITTNASGIAPYLRGLTPVLVAVMAFIALFSATAYLWGLVAARLLRQPRDVTVSMTFGAGMRNISAGAVIAANYFPPEVMFPVVIGTLFQQVLAATYDRVLARALPRQGAGA